MEGSFPTWLRANSSKLVSISVANDSPLSLQECHNCPEQFTDPLFYGHISEEGVRGWWSGIPSRAVYSTSLTLDSRSFPGENLIGFHPSNSCFPDKSLSRSHGNEEVVWGNRRSTWQGVRTPFSTTHQPYKNLNEPQNHGAQKLIYFQICTSVR